MGSYTQQLNLYKPNMGEFNWHIPLNENFEKIDSEVGYKCVLNKGCQSPAQVTESAPTLKQSVQPDKQRILLVESIHVVADNPSGSGVTLYFMLKALLEDESEVNLLDQEEEIAEGMSFDDWLIDIMQKIPNQSRINEVRLYAYCSSTPNEGFEPTIHLERVVGVQN